VTAIKVTANDVTIDLNGFAILGPAMCESDFASPPAVTCTNTGSGIGIEGGLLGMIVYNGTVRGMGFTGISAAIHSNVERVHVFSNGGSSVRRPGQHHQGLRGA
jgi:hypothetical protein